MKIRRLVVLGIFAAVSSALHADFTYQETTQITGGSVMGMMKVAGAFSKQARAAGAPVVSTVIIKGNRMAHITQDKTEIVDLDRETITDIDNVKRQYTVITFEQMKRQIDEAARKAKQEQQKSGQATPEQPANTELKFQVNVRNTGAAKQVAGLDTSESILTMAMNATDKTSGQSGALAITNDMWLAPDIPGYGEARDFYRRYAVKMGMVFSGAINSSMLALQPGAGQGMADMVKEMSKLKGVPVLQIMRVGTTANGQPLPAASEAPLPASTSPAMPSAGDVAQQAATSVIASKLGALGAMGGSLGGFGRKKKVDPAPAPAPSQGQGTTDAPATAAVLIESNTQLTGFSRDVVAESKLAVPTGYKQVEPKTTE